LVHPGDAEALIAPLFNRFPSPTHRLHSVIMKALPILLALAFSSLAAFAAGDYEQKIDSIKKEFQAKRGEGREAVLKFLEEQGTTLVRDYPDQPDGYQMLVSVLENSEPKKADEILKLIDTPKAPAEIREVVAGIRAKREALGKPVDIKFKAVDGRDVDLASMKGKVVLIDFWATWCGPCVGEIPHVKEAYEKLHPNGFEIVGISLDQDKAKLESFVKEKEMTWPQYFDGEGWKNKFAQKFGINAIPAMWLVDKKGNLVDMEGRDDLRSKVEKLLAQ
jgi:thiol-disulfide isomerase/thioredoxin